MWPTSRAHSPAQFTTCSACTVPLSVTHLPGAVTPRRERQHAREALDRGAQGARRLDVGVGGAGGVAVAAVGAPQGADEVAGIDERVVLECLLERDHLGLHAEVAGARADEAQAVELALVGGEHQTAVGVQTARLPGERLDLAVQVDGVFLQTRDVRFAVEGVHAAGGVPGRAGRELALLQQQHVTPAGLGQVVEHARAHHAAADDDHSRRSLHDCTSPHSAARSTSGRS